MILSMTGYGRDTNHIGELEITVEIRSVNNRFLDVVAKLPKCLIDYEQQIRDMITKKVSRGRVNVWISLTGGDDKYQNLKLNKPLATAYSRIVQEIRDELNVEGQFDIGQLLGLQDVIVSDNSDTASDETWACTKQAISDALDKLYDYRLKEGNTLKQDFKNRISNLQRLSREIEELSKNRPLEELDKLRTRVNKLVSNEQFDEGRLEMELALLSDRMDITEECVRFQSHNKLFVELLEADESVGRKLNFLLQEMNREANTIGSKANSSPISHLVVEVKEEIERIREQVQNIE